MEPGAMLKRKRTKKEPINYQGMTSSSSQVVIVLKNVLEIKVVKSINWLNSILINL